jgi:flagellar basal-body rod modification protein FlgD
MTITTAPVATTPTSSTTTANTVNTGLAQVADNYQTFLSLLTTQLKNQDPLSPLDTNQFTQQLTQMTGVEQQLLSNKLLQQLVDQNQGGGGLSSAVGLIGKTVTADESTAPLQNGKATWQFNLPSSPASMSVSVLDSSGNTVWSSAVTPNGSGPQSFTWNGQNTSGQQQADGGTYKLAITANDASGAPIAVSSAVQGVATAVQTLNGQTMVTVGGTVVPLSSITGVSG